MFLLCFPQTIPGACLFVKLIDCLSVSRNYITFAKIFKNSVFMKKNYVSPSAVEVVAMTETVLAGSAPAYRMGEETETGAGEGKGTTWGSLWK